jgi:hypothetical protein
VLPTLTVFRFKGVSEYLEDFVARIDTPLMHDLLITLFLDLVFDVPQLQKFIDRTERLKPLNHVLVTLDPYSVTAILQPPTDSERYHIFQLEILCRVSDWQVSSIARVCDQLLHTVSQVERLDIDQTGDELEWQDDGDPTVWLELFNPFISVKSLYVSKMLRPRVVLALKQLAGERATEVLPSLHSMFFKGPRLSELEAVEEDIKPFITARQLTDHPVVVQYYE